MANGDEHTHGIELPGFAAQRGTQPDTGNAAAVAQHLVKGVIPLDCHVAALDLLVQTILQDLLATKAIAPMNQRDFRGDIGEIERFFHRRIAAANHDDILVAIEEAIAGSAGGNALSHELLLRRQPQISGAGTGGDDQRVAGIGAVVPLERERLLAQLDLIDVIEQHFGLETLRMLAHALHQFGALDAFLVARPVVDVGGRGQLPASLHARDQQRLEIRPRGVDGGRVTGRPGAQDNQTFVARVAHDYLDSINDLVGVYRYSTSCGMAPLSSHARSRVMPQDTAIGEMIPETTKAARRAAFDDHAAYRLPA